jgi:hypothetical protein
VVGSGSNVILHLRPAPVVARVMSGTAVLHDDPRLWLEREVAVGVYAGARTEAVVPPSDVVPPGPHQHDGFWITFWRYVEHDADAIPDGAAVGQSLRELHDAMAGYPGELAPLGEVREAIARMVAAVPEPEPFRDRLDGIDPRVFCAGPDAQPLHGDASLGNLLVTERGPVWNDLEDVCRGPVEWDVAGVVHSARVRGLPDAFTVEVLAAYDGPSLDDLAPLLAAHELYLDVWQAFDRARRGPA